MPAPNAEHVLRLAGELAGSPIYTPGDAWDDDDMVYAAPAMSASELCSLVAISCEMDAEEVFAHICGSSGPAAVLCVRDEHINPEWLRRLVYETVRRDDINDQVAAFAAQNPSLSPGDTELLLHHECPDVQHYAASNGTLTQEAFEELHTHSYPEIRCVVAHSTRTSVDTLAKLACDRDWRVAWAVARNANTSTDTLRVLATNNSFDVCTAAAQHPNTPDVVLDQLIEDGHKAVGLAAQIHRTALREAAHNAA